MAEKKTKTGKTVQQYIRDVLEGSSKAGEAAVAAGYPERSRYTEAYLAGIPYLYQYGDAEQAEALGRMGDLYGAYGRAGQYDMTNFGDIEGLYRQASQYGTMDYGDLESEYGGVGGYVPREYEDADYTTGNIKSRMSPYEELVSERARSRLKKGYDEARGERESQAARAGAFGGSGAAIQEEVARRNYLEQMADMDAQNLQQAYEAGVGLYSKEMADRLASGQAEEASRQFAKNLQLDVLSGKMTARQAEEASRQFGRQAQFTGLEGMMGARQQRAAQIAAAKEAEFAALQGQGTSAQQQAALAEQRKNMALTNYAAMQQAGREQEAYQRERQEYPLYIYGQQANILSPIEGAGAIQQKQKDPSLAQNILGGISAGIGVGSGLGLFRQSGVVYRGGGLADLEPEYYSHYEY